VCPPTGKDIHLSRKKGKKVFDFFELKVTKFHFLGRDSYDVPASTSVERITAFCLCPGRAVIYITLLQTNVVGNHANYAMMPRLLLFAGLYKNMKYT
jgi:hypothetical protein